jgi:hypothetical protein
MDWPETSYSHTHMQNKYSMRMYSCTHMQYIYCKHMYSHIHIQKTNVRVHAYENAGPAPKYMLHIQTRIHSRISKKRSICAYPYTSNRRLRLEPIAQHIIIIIALFLFFFFLLYMPAIEGCLTNPVCNWAPSNM